MNKIRILFIEDNRILRQGIESMLKKHSDMFVTGTDSSSKDILQITGKLKPNILLFSLGLQNRKSLQLVKLIRENSQEIKIIVMDTLPIQSDVFEYVQAGVSGFILKDANTAQFVKTIRTVYQGAKVLPPDLTDPLFSQIFEHAISGSNSSEIDKSVQMTKREREVVDLIAEGLTNKEIAQRLHLSSYTVKSHVHNILKKLTLSTRVQIAKYIHLSESNKNTLDNTSLFEA